LALFSGFESIIFLAWWLGIVSFAGSALLFLFVMALRFYSNFKRLNSNNFAQIWESIILDSLDESPQNIPNIAKREEITFLILWNHLQEVLREESKENLFVLADRINLLTIGRKYVKKSNIKNKLLAINTLGLLQDKESWEIIEALSNDKATSFSLTAARALIRIDCKKATQPILSLIMEREDWSIESCADLIIQIESENIADDLIDKIYHTPKHLLPRMIRFLNLLQPNKTNMVLKNLMNKYDDTEIIYACISVFKDVDNLGYIRKLLTHESWEIRMKASVCLGEYGSEREIARLTKGTMDTEWWVRYRSAQALVKIPNMTARKLKNIAKRDSDGFSHDVILRAVKEKEVAESCGLTY
jgi:HEAT repeat protein